MPGIDANAVTMPQRSPSEGGTTSPMDWPIASDMPVPLRMPMKTPAASTITMTCIALAPWISMMSRDSFSLR